MNNVLCIIPIRIVGIIKDWLENIIYSTYSKYVLIQKTFAQKIDLSF